MGRKITVAALIIGLVFFLNTAQYQIAAAVVSALLFGGGFWVVANAIEKKRQASAADA